VCTTELGAFAKLKNEFDARGVKMIGLVCDRKYQRMCRTRLTRMQSANDLGSHEGWIQDINEIANTNLSFPIIADHDRKVAFLYDMINQEDLSIAFTIRSVFVIDPQKKVRLTMMYPASTGRNSAEVLRVIDSLQTADKKGIATPINWQVGEDVIVPPAVSTEDAKKKFNNVRELKPYLRYAEIK
jgi:alkyl hydroperoxide reductase subunit AhpC